MADNKQTIVNAIKSAGKPVRPGDIAQATGIDKGEVSKIMGELKKEGVIYSPKRCFWAPVEE